MALNLDNAGAVGDGITDDHAAIQLALDNGGPGTFSLGSGNVYLIGDTISLRTGQMFDGNFKTVKLKGNTNKAMFTNTGSESPAGIRNITLDGNVASQETDPIAAGALTFGPAIYFVNGPTGVKLFNITINDFWAGGIYFASGTNFEIDNVITQGGYGRPFNLNGTGHNVGYIEANDNNSFTGVPQGSEPWGLEANACAIDANDSFFRHIRYDNIVWGFKLQGGSLNNHFGIIHASNTKDIVQDVKFQGAGGGNENDGVTVDRVICENSPGNGLYIWETRNITIKQVELTNNGTGWVTGADFEDYFQLNVRSCDQPVTIEKAILREGFRGGCTLRSATGKITIKELEYTNTDSLASNPVYVADAEDVVIEDMNVEVTNVPTSRIVYVIGDSGTSFIDIGRLVIDKSMTIDPTFVFNDTGGPFLVADYVKDGSNAAASVSDNTYTPL